MSFGALRQINGPYGPLFVATPNAVARAAGRGQGLASFGFSFSNFGLMTTAQYGAFGWFRK